MLPRPRANASAGMPPAHVGVNAGPVVFRDGDYFGRTVNIAARIASRAGPGEVVASEEAVALASVDGVKFEELGPAELKGARTLYQWQEGTTYRCVVQDQRLDSPSSSCSW